ncbi:hypothetical protein LEP1GSC123_0106 [Leptospira borgpetersenii str. 200701203]|uniref:Uncharacterized protein n=1 Tax=Leptospira borgpetersenii str. 200701203 TaxID=1193007 RepID=M3GDN9_LEPBO|nr:hypothetical protein LEP1GSC123_0106 [Leptospira borgpetersenii str. 200701203]
MSIDLPNSKNVLRYVFGDGALKSLNKILNQEERKYKCSFLYRYLF